MSDAPDRAWLDANWASGIRPEATDDKWEDDDVEYIRADVILSDPRVKALVDAAKLEIAAYEADDGRMIQGYHALVDALAALQVKP